MINELISAAAFLYAHSPAERMTAEKNTIIVSGRAGDPLAEAVFDLLFTTAWRAETVIRLVRLVPEGAAEAEQAFICRNEKGIGCFAGNALLEPDENRTMTLCFMDEREYDPRKEADRTAWAVCLDGSAAPVSGDACFSAPDVPLLQPRGGRWTAADEQDLEVLQVTRRVHTAYTASWNSRYREEEISRDLYGQAGAGDTAEETYALRSSLRMAVSIPWKLKTAGVKAGEGAPEALYRKLNGEGGEALRNVLAWQEHRSWMAFMTLDGWRMPTREEMKAYVFRDGNDHRNKKEKLHPCLCDLQTDDWFAPHAAVLKDIPAREWIEKGKNPEDFCLLDRMSLAVHRRCKELVTSPEYGERLRGLFRDLDKALQAAYLPGAEAHYRRARTAENMFRRMLNNETGSFHAWHRACGSFSEGLAGAGGRDTEGVRAAFAAVRREATAAEERNRYRDYREIDADIIRWLPWMLQPQAVGTIWKPFERNNLLENVLSSIIVRPAALTIVCADGDAKAVPVKEYQDLLARHGCGGVRISVKTLSDFPEGALPVKREDLVDVTGAAGVQPWLTWPAETRTVFYGGDDLQDRRGAPFFAPLFHPYDFSMMVDEMLRLRGRKLLSDTEDNDMLGMEEDYLDLWHARVRMREGRYRAAWHWTIAALREAEEAVRCPFYRNTGIGRKPFRFSFPPEQYADLLRTGADRVLRELEERGGLVNLVIDAEGGAMTCDLFPDPKAGGNPYEATEAGLRRMLEDQRPDSRYALIDEYVKNTEPFCCVSLSDPVAPDRNRLAARLFEIGQREVKRGAWKPDRVPSVSALSETLAFGFGELEKARLILPAAGGPGYTFRSLPVRKALRKEGTALEAYVYYSLYLSGEADDVRSNVRFRDGVGADGTVLEKEVDILVTKKGRMGIISCKDTDGFSIGHLGELRMQADRYGINARPILACTRTLTDEQLEMTRYLNIGVVSAGGSFLDRKILKLLR